MSFDARNMEITDADLARLLMTEIQNATGADWDETQANRSDALDYYFSRAPGKPVTAGRSGAISSDVADMVEALKAQIMPSFSGDNVVSFEANGQQDEKQAQMESDIVNYMVMERSNGYQIIYEAVHDALLMRNCIVKVYVDEYERVGKKLYQPLDETTLQIMQAETQDTLYAEDNDQGTIITRLTKVRKLCVESVDPDNFVVASDHRSLDMQSCRFCAEWFIRTVGQLIEMGFDPEVVDDLPSAPSDSSTASVARNQSALETDHFWFEESGRPIKIWECYYQADLDGDGYPELHKILFCENHNVILSDELVDFVPYACGTPFINPHRWMGIGIFDKLKAVADGKTDVLRQWIDNSKYHNNRALKCVRNQYSRDDVLNRRPGGSIEVASPESVTELQVMDIGPSCQNFLAYMDKMRSEKCGASLDMQTEGLPSGDETAHGVERQMSFKEQLAGMITRTLAETVIRAMFLLVHKTLRLYFPGTITARRTGLWIESDPSTWGERENVNINVGYSIGERQRQAAALLQVMQLQIQDMQLGLDGITTGAEQLFNARIDYCRLLGLDAPMQYWINPNSQQAQQAAVQKGQQAQAQSASQQAMTSQVLQIEAFKARQQAQNELAKHELDAAKLVLEQQDTIDDNRRAWAELELKYSRPIEGEGI